MMRITALTGCVLALFSIGSFGSDITCPKAEAIIAMGLNHIQLTANGWVAGFRPAQFYGTTLKWSFLIGKDESQLHGREEDAMRDAMHALSTLHFVKGPERAPGYNVCYYESETPGMLAASLNPPV